MISLTHVVTGSNWARCAAIAAIGLATGCAHAPSIDGDPAAAAAEIGQATPAAESIPPVASAAPSSSPVTSLPASQALPTLDEVLAEERFVPLAVALERSGLDEVIDGLDDVVLLAPTGSAFASAGTDVGVEYSTLMNNPRLLEAIIRYHVVADPSVNVSWRTLNGAVLDVTASDPGTIDGVEVVDRIPVRNGIVLVMPRLLLPASP